MAALKFPKRFEIENLDPHQLQVVVVGRNHRNQLEQNVYANLQMAASAIDFNDYCGPMADKHNGQWCVRFESKGAYKMLSA